MSLLFPLSIKACLLLPLPLACLLLSFIVVWTLHFCLFGCSKERECEVSDRSCSACEPLLAFPLLIALLLLPRHSRLPFCALSVCSLSIPLLLLVTPSIHSSSCSVVSVRSALLRVHTASAWLSLCQLSLSPSFLLTCSLSLSLSPLSLSVSLSLSLSLKLSLFACMFLSLSASLNKVEKKQKSPSNVSLHELVKK